MEIDWIATGTMVAGIGNLASAFAVAFAAWTAADTFKGWKLRRASEREEEIAQRTLLAAYRVKEAVRAIRSPYYGDDELATAPSSPADDDETSSTEMGVMRPLLVSVYRQRLEQHRFAFSDLQDCAPYALAVFGPKVFDAIGQLGRCQFFMECFLEYRFDQTKVDVLKLKAMLTDFHDQALEGDGPISRSIKESIETIEKVCLPVLRPEWRG